MKKSLFTLAALLGLTTAAAAPATDTIAYANTIEILPGDSHETIVAKAAHIVPAQRQLDALRREFIAFVHFGPNTFTRREWGTGFENPKDFALETLDTDQWAKAMKDAGMKLVILTVKHHDGFVIYQSRYTDHGIMSSPFQDGKGDILRDLAASCRKYGLELGVYLSPADLYQIENPEGLYGNGSTATERVIPRPVEGRPFTDKRTFTFKVDDYNEYFLNQLFELLTEYGPVKEVWFDGAHPKHKGGQKYNDTAWKQLIRTLAPDAVIFGRADVRWGGNEGGATRKAEFNAIPYPANPDTMQVFFDIMDPEPGSREKLYEGKYLHYQQPEINTSIREGWFYRDDDKQGVRSADDVFDIYERAVGGNATFLLNIPPNREGRFSDRDVAVLEETGRRIRATYGTDLLKGIAHGPAELLDDDASGTFIDVSGPVEITLDKPVKINRLMLQEAIADRGERIEAVALDAWTGGEWKEIAVATNVGYKRILRFPTVATDRLRIRVTESRLTPTLSNVAAYFYDAPAPEIAVGRNHDGKVALAPRRADFNWNAGAGNPAETLSNGCEIRYTVDGSEPTEASTLYTGPFAAANATVRTASWLNSRRGTVTTEQLGYTTEGWATATDDQRQAIDGDAATVFVTDPREPLTIDFGKKLTINGFAYTPPTESKKGLVDEGRIEVSSDGKKWRKADDFEFGNLNNDPTRRFHHFKKPLKARYFRFVPTRSTNHDTAASVAEIMIF